MAEESGEKSVHLDEVLSKFGLFSRYHIQTILLIGFAFFNNAMHCVNFIFVAEDLPYRCKIEQCESQDKVFDSPWYNFTAPDEYRSCFKYGSVENSECSPINFNSTIVQPCTDWIYSVDNSFVSEFQLGCQDWKRTFVGTVHSIGLMIGLFFQGQLSDRIGRKAAIILAGLAAGVFGVAKSFANTYILFVVLELLESIFGDNCSPAFIMSVELVDSDKRLLQQLFVCIMFSMGGVTFSIVAYLVPYWRNLIRAIYAPSFLIILYYFILDESVRWLLSKGKKEKATNILLKVAKTSRVDLDKKTLVNIKYEDSGTQTSPLLDTLRSRIVLKRFTVCLVWWISCTFIGFGLMVNMVYLAGNKYVNFIIMSLCDIPASFLLVYVLKKFNRKKPLLISFMSAGVLCVVQPFIPKSFPILATCIYFLGRFTSTFMFSTVYMYTCELFPTYSRNSMHALCSAIGRIGSILAPMTPLLTQYMESLPTLLIGCISIFAGLTTIFVPDVADDTLPDNVEQAEFIGLSVNNVKEQVSAKFNGEV